MTTSPSTPGCPDDEHLARLTEGALDEDSRARVEAHLDACAACAHAMRELAALQPGAALDLPRRYRVGRRIGSGGMGVIYEAEDAHLRRRVALKLVHPARLGDDGDRARLLREGRVLASLDDPNVLPVYDAGRSGDHAYVVTALVAGQSARAWRASTPRSWREVLAVYSAAGRGLAAAHRAGVIHRDVKPDNVLVADSGRVYLADFGLATPAGAAPGTWTTTTTPMHAGTPAYMAPEQLRGNAATVASDQFSYAVSLWEALTGERPFQGANAADLALAIATETPCTGGRSVPARVRAVVARGLRLTPSERWPSVDALLEALETASRPLTSRAAWLLVPGLVLAGALAMWPRGGEKVPAASAPPSATATPVQRPRAEPVQPSATATPVQRPRIEPVQPSATATPVQRPRAEPLEPGPFLKKMSNKGDRLVEAGDAAGCVALLVPHLPAADALRAELVARHPDLPLHATRAGGGLTSFEGTYSRCLRHAGRCAEADARDRERGVPDRVIRWASTRHCQASHR